MSDLQQRIPNFQKVAARIQALRERTVERGFTENEAIAAAKKLADILDQYELSLSDVDIKDQDCKKGLYDTGRKKRVAPVDYIVKTIAEFCDVMSWKEKSKSRRAHCNIQHVFFGLPADVEAAIYLLSLIDIAIVNETEKFKKSLFYTNAKSSRSFQFGMAFGIEAKLKDIKAERIAQRARAEQAAQAERGEQETATGTELISLKHEAVQAEYEALNLELGQAPKSKLDIKPEAFKVGEIVGRRFEITPGVGHSDMGKLA